MTSKFLASAVTALACAAFAAPAVAQSAPAPSANSTPSAQAPGAAAATTAALSVGATVYGSDGNPVGTIDKIDNGTAVINSGAATAALPLDKFGTSDKGPTIGFTKSQFEAAANGAKQQAPAG